MCTCMVVVYIARLLYMTIGCKEKGDPSQSTFRHTTGEGWVQAKKGHYDDAIHTKLQA